MTEVHDDALTVPELLATELAMEPVSYRQIDYWIGCGLIYADEPHPGSGNERRVPVSEVPVIRLIGRLTLGGMRLQPAATLARQLATGQTSVEFAGLTVVVVGAISSVATNPTPPGAAPDAAVVLADVRRARDHLQDRRDRAADRTTPRNLGRVSAYDECIAALNEVVSRHG